MNKFIAEYAAANPEFLSAGLLCCFIIIIAGFLLVLVRRINARKTDQRTEDQQLGPKSADRAQRPGTPAEKPKRQPRPRHAVEPAHVPSPAGSVKAAGAVPEAQGGQMPVPSSASKNEAARVPMPEEVQADKAAVQPTAAAVAAKPAENQPALTGDKVAPPAVEPIKPEPQPGNPSTRPSDEKIKTPTASEKTSAVPESKEKSAQASAFDIFTNVAVQQSEISKFASKLEDVSVSDLSKQVNDVFSAFKSRRKN
jgi:hypothetical protein